MSCLVSSFGPKYKQKFLTISALESKKCWNQQNEGTFLHYYNLHLMCKRHYRVLILWFDQFSNSRAGFVKFFRWCFGPNHDTKRTFWNQLTFSTGEYLVVNFWRKFPWFIQCASWWGYVQAAVGTKNQLKSQRADL